MKKLPESRNFQSTELSYGMLELAFALAFTSTHILLSDDVPVLLHYRLLYAATLSVTCNIKKLFLKHLRICLINHIVYIELRGTTKHCKGPSSHK